ncbi:oxygen-independent coproporphyrinogen III oxidase [Sphingomonas sp. S2-65]|uniref:oxygen-independent coproporphyrinogen III oxidase n=1 Tax=Sphingomonas sp. S2-65 TaxID=2903960 RepID=UPI001F444726|nr:oxygen-independent coproporphyrinogen III oxidase [Sphingomonas sp. S2-65]UYY57109.1 oxygen-independent coproporphyrinogen III oxidase [Sphingomonas sp. S2-65]
MWTYHSDLLARPVPRYTSYPTAAEFHEQVGPEDLGAALDLIDLDDTVSLYVHIPYCREICWYCGCNTGAANRSGRLTAYLERLREEIDLVARRLGARGRIGRIAFGGGSPNAIAPVAFVGLVDQLVQRFRCQDAVLSVEIDPRGFDADWATALADTGVTRASLGVQTFDPALQAAIGRIQPAEQILRTTELLRRAGVSSINFDLMYGLPGQSAAMLEQTLAEARALAPERLAVFGYAHVPQLIARQRRIDATALPGPAERFEQAALAYETLTGTGYRAVGFDHFAVPGDALALAAEAGTLRRNFQGFTEDQASILLGLGASAISEFPDRLLQNEKNTGRYGLAIEHQGFATARGVHRTAEDRRRGHAIVGILTAGHAELGAVAGLDAVRLRLEPFEAAGLVGWQGTRLQLGDGALPYARAIAATLDDYRQHGPGRFSNAV